MSGDSLMARPGPDGRFGEFGGRFVRLSFSNPTSDIERFVRAFPLAVETLRPAAPGAKVPTARAE